MKLRSVVSTRRFRNWLRLVPLLVVVAGCNRPQFEEVQAARSQRLARYAERIREGEARRPGNLRKLCALHAELEDRRLEHGRQMRCMIRTRHETRPRREPMSDFTALFRESQADRIPARFARMFY